MAAGGKCSGRRERMCNKDGLLQLLEGQMGLGAWIRSPGDFADGKDGTDHLLASNCCFFTCMWTVACSKYSLELHSLAVGIGSSFASA